MIPSGGFSTEPTWRQRFWAQDNDAIRHVASRARPLKSQERIRLGLAGRGRRGPVREGSSAPLVFNTLARLDLHRASFLNLLLLGLGYTLGCRPLCPSLVRGVRGPRFLW